MFNLSCYEHVSISLYFIESNLPSVKQIHILQTLTVLSKLLSLNKFPYFHQYLTKSSTLVLKTTRHTPDYYTFPTRTVIASNTIFNSDIKLRSHLPTNYKISNNS